MTFKPAHIHLARGLWRGLGCVLGYLQSGAKLGTQRTGTAIVSLTHRLTHPSSHSPIIGAAKNVVVDARLVCKLINFNGAIDLRGQVSLTPTHPLPTPAYRSASPPEGHACSRFPAPAKSIVGVPW